MPDSRITVGCCGDVPLSILVRGAGLRRFVRVWFVSSSFLLSGQGFLRSISGRNLTQANVQISGACSE
jgi:hypothetical protein